MRKLLLYTAVPLIAACLSLKGAQATEIGGTVPKATGAGQGVYSGSTAPFYWQPVTLPYGMHGTGQMAVGGTVDTATRFTVAPQGTAENGVSVTMPSGATGAALQVKTSTGTKVFGVAPSGAVAAAGYAVGSAAGLTVTVTLAGGAGTLFFTGGILTATTAGVITTVNTAEQGYPEGTG